MIAATNGFTRVRDLCCVLNFMGMSRRCGHFSTVPSSFLEGFRFHWSYLGPSTDSQAKPPWATGAGLIAGGESVESSTLGVVFGSRSHVEVFTIYEHSPRACSLLGCQDSFRCQAPEKPWPKFVVRPAYGLPRAAETTRSLRAEHERKRHPLGAAGTEVPRLVAQQEGLVLQQ